MESHHDTQDKNGIWPTINLLLGTAFTLFAAISAIALIYGGIKHSRAHGKQETPVSAPQTASSATPAPAAEASGSSAVPAGTGMAPKVVAPSTPGTSPAPAPTDNAPAPAVVSGNDVAVVTIKPGALNPMSFDQPSFTVKAGQKVKLTFNNESATAPLQHNLILCKTGSKERIMAAANAMMLDMAKWLPLGFVPESPDIIVHTKLLNPKESETLEFNAPAEKGDYPYLCTFPGHALIMNGVMKVE